MKVAYLINQYPHASHSFVRREIRALESLGLEVTRISVRRSSAPLVDPDDVEEETRTRFVLDGSKAPLLVRAAWTALTRPGRTWRALQRAWAHGRRSQRPAWLHLVYLIEAATVAAWCRKAGVEHLHAHFGTNASTVALLAHELGGAPFSFTVHGPEEFDRPESLSIPDKIAACRFVAAVSSFGRSQLFRWCPAHHWSKVRVVHCGLDRAFLQAETSPTPNAARLVSVGRLCEQKGPLLLVRAMGALRRKGVEAKLVMIGDGPLRAEVEREIAAHDLGETVELRGWADSDTIRDELRAARAMVLPSFAEGLPVVLMEALAMRRSVVTTYIAGIPELVRPPEGGWLVPAGSVSDLAAALEEVLTSSPETLDARAVAGAERVARRHDAVREATRLAEAFGAKVDCGEPLSTEAEPVLVEVDG